MRETKQGALTISKLHDFPLYQTVLDEYLNALHDTDTDMSIKTIPYNINLFRKNNEWLNRN